MLSFPAAATVLTWGSVELVLRARLIVRPGMAARVRAAPAIARQRLREWTFLVVVGAIAAAVLAAFWLAQAGSDATGGGTPVVVAGEIVAAAGLALRLWAILTLDQLFTFVVGIAADHRVVQSGPYRFLRHPGYAGVLVTLLGVGITLRDWLSLLLITVVPLLALGIRIAVEESTLTGALGPEYSAYAARTARLIPGIW
jgi:protein-S-isoprenylcysteine O-methyltransferase Ste14